MRRVVVATLAVAALALLAIWLLRRDDKPDRAADADRAADDAVRARRARGFGDPLATRHAWFGLPGAPDRRVAGVVLYAGRPVPGATVRLWSELTKLGLDPSGVITTDEHGAFDFGERAASVYGLAATAGDREPATMELDLRNPAIADPSRIELVLHDCAAHVAGTVRDSARGTIAGAEVSLIQDGAVFQTQADERGDYTACVRPGDLQLRAWSDGYADDWAFLQLVTRARQDFRLRPAATIRGRVVHGDQPVAGALVGSSQSPSPDVVSDADGNFVLDRLAPGRHTITARTDTRLSDPVDAVAVVGGEPEPIVLRLVDAATVRGRALMGDQPAPGVAIWLGERGEYTTFSQEDGSFVIGAVIAGTYPAGATDDSGYELVSPKRVDIAAPATELTLQVKRLATVRGRVTRGRKPVHGALVYGPPGSTRTDSAGKFELRGWQPGEHKIGAQSAHEGAFTRDVTVRIRGGETIEGIELELDLAAAIAGRVVDQNGRPVPDVHVHFELVDGQDVGDADTGPDGRFEAKAMSGGGDYTVSVRRRAYGIQLEPAPGRPFPVVALADGRSRADGVDIAITRPDGRVSGRVIRRHGQPVADVAVSTGSMTDTVLTDSDGRFAFDDVAPGEAWIAVLSPEGDRMARQVAVPATDVVFTLPDPGRIEGKLVGFTGPVTIEVRTRYSPDDSSSTEHSFGHYTQRVSTGSFSIPSVAPGRYSVLATSSDASASAETTVTAGKTARVTLDGSGSGRIVGRVVEFETGKPLSEAYCHWSAELAALGAYARTEPDGSFTLVVPPGELRVSCFGGPQGASTTPRVKIARGASEQVEIFHVAGEPGAIAGVEPGPWFPAIPEVEAGSLFAEAGLRAGDRIVAVDDLDVSKLDVNTVYQLLLNRVDRGQATLTVARGRDRVDVVLPLSATERQPEFSPR